MNVRPKGLSWWMLAASLLPVGVCPAAAAEQIISVAGRKVGIALVPEKPEIMLGEPAAVRFTLKNYSDTTLHVMEGGDYRNNLGRQDSFKVAVRAADGRPVPQPDVGPGFGGLMGLKEVPAGGSHVFRLFLPHWARFSSAGSYSITVNKRLEFSLSKDDGFQPDKLTKADVQAEAVITVVPGDYEEMGKIIDAIGESLLRERDDQWPDTPAQRLAVIEDARVIPWYARAFATKSYSLKFAALTGLAKFNDAEAFGILKQGLEVRAADLEGAIAGQPDNQLAQNIRHAAAGSLARSDYPGAGAFLLSRRDDASTGVRLTILHLLGKMPAGEAVPILEEMTQDKDWRVSQEAKRYLEIFRAKK